MPTFVGSDYHEGSIATARQRAAEAGVSGRVRFETTPASSYSGTGYDLVTMFDCLHDMGDPVGAARHVRQSQAGEARIRDVVTRGGLTRFRRVSETPFNLVFEARP